MQVSSALILKSVIISEQPKLSFARSPGESFMSGSQQFHENITRAYLAKWFSTPIDRRTKISLIPESTKVEFKLAGE